MTTDPFVHETAEVGDLSRVGEGTHVWHHAQVMEGAEVGRNCTIGKGAFVGRGSIIGDFVKVGNYANLFGPEVENEAFIGPLACVMEDPAPRSTNGDGTRREAGDFEQRPAAIRRGASVGSGALILPGVEVGPWALVSAGAVVHRDVAPHTIVAGNPARAVGIVCRCGRHLDSTLECACGLHYRETDLGLEVFE